MSKFKFLFALLFGFVVIFSCGEKETVVDCQSVVAADNTYTKSLKSIVDASCATSGCHTQSDKAGGIMLHNYERVRSNFVSGKGLCSIKHRCVPMPEDAPMLSASVIQKFECWVEAGTPE